jgi:DOPA 4,5-dioxygenase
MKPVSEIASYHAHIYFQGAQERERAEAVRRAIAERFLVQLGRWHDRPIGPHELPMYQVAFDIEVFPRLIPWLMLNRQGLTVLLHPNTLNPREDHLFHAVWMGKKMSIMHPDMLPEEDSSGRDSPIIPNTSPTLPA